MIGGVFMNKDSLTKETRELWDNVLSQKMPSEAVVLQFLVGKLDLDYLSAHYQADEQEKCISTLMNYLLNTSIKRIRELLSSVPLTIEVSAANVPQFSNFATAVIYLPELLLISQTQLTYREMGYSLYSETKTDGSAEKYGQNHGSLAIQLGLATNKKIGNKSVFFPTPLTAKYCRLEHANKMELLQRLCYRIPVIQKGAISETPVDIVDECLRKTLAESTYKRRKPNVLEVLAFALGE